MLSIHEQHKIIISYVMYSYEIDFYLQTAQNHIFIYLWTIQWNYLFTSSMIQSVIVMNIII